MKVSSNVLDRQYLKYKDEYEKKIVDVLRKGWYVLGPEVEGFENDFAKYCNSKYCVGLASGLDALILAVRALDIKPGDEVLVQANTYIATVMGITINGATPIFIEPDEFYNIDTSKLEEKITDKTKAIMVTHLYGQAANMKDVKEIADKYNLYIIEDCAQAHGAKYNGQIVGTFGDVGCYSFYPSKNLGAFGDAGAIITNNKEIADKIRILRNYGSEKRYHNKYVGMNSRLDEIQAALLRIKLTHIEELTEERCSIAKKYNEGIKNNLIELPRTRENATSVNHLYVIKTTFNDSIQYISNIILRFIGFIITLLILISLWNFIYSDGEGIINGYTFNQMIWYLWDNIISLTTKVLMKYLDLKILKTQKMIQE